jgi:N-acetylmuramoyl-L-alanine amidase
MNLVSKIMLGSVIFFTAVTTDSSARMQMFDPTPHGNFDYFVNLECMALNIYNEARGEPLSGKNAVAWVVMNRVADSRYQSTPCEVVYAGELQQNWKGNWYHVKNRCSFSWVCDGNPNNDVPIIRNAIDQKNWDESIIVAKYALDGVSEDPTRGATHYYAHNIVTPNWGYPKTTIVANHSFVRKP